MFDLNIAVLRPSERLKSLPKRSDAGLHLGIMFGECVQKHDPPHPRWLLRPRPKRPSRCRAAEQRDEFAASYVEHGASPPLWARGAGDDHKPADGPCSRLLPGSAYHEGGWKSLEQT